MCGYGWDKNMVTRRLIHVFNCVRGKVELAIAMFVTSFFIYLLVVGGE